MPAYPPGSFTKNFGWAQKPPGLRALYEAIRLGFQRRFTPVSRNSFRSHSGISDPNRQLIPINFFLHNTVRGTENFISTDELIRQALASPHSRRFDLLALFALHLARMGRRIGTAGDSKGAGFCNEFVRTTLWNNGGWERSNLADPIVERSFNATVIATGADTIHKCITNYLFILEVCGIKNQTTKYINTRIDEWVGPGLFLAFDRFWLDEFSGKKPTAGDLATMARTDELHKLMGTSAEYLDTITPLIAQEYLAVGGIDRPFAIAPAATTSTTKKGTSAAPVATAPKWSDEAEEIASVMRRLREVQAQIRNPRNVAELKFLYDNRCAFCGKQTIVGVGPDKHYSEAAHIRPLGEPHKGPDKKSNMLILCSEHHLQFDRGVLTLRRSAKDLIIKSKIPGDPSNGAKVQIRPPHEIDDEFVKWHANYWR
jgi:hypothetical protein